MTDSGFSIRPDELQQSGSHLRNFGDQVAASGDKLQSIGQKLVAHAGADKSGVGKIISDVMGRGTEVAGKVFSEGGRVAGAAGQRLHATAATHTANEAQVVKSFNGIKDPAKTPKAPGSATGDTPRGRSGSGGKRRGTGNPPRGNSGSGGKTPHTHGATTPASIKTKIKHDNTSPHQNGTATADRTFCGDPIDVATGRMMLTEQDIELAGVLPLIVTRTHVSGYRLGRWFGGSWASTVDQRLEIEEDGVHFAVEDGRLLSYPVPPVEGAVLPVVGARWPLERSLDGGYVVTDPAGDRLWHFRATGGDVLPISAIVDGDGNRIDFDYDASGTLTELRHSAGYRVAVRTADGLITALYLLGAEDAAGTVLMEYRYDEQRQLVEVVNSSGQPLRFEYDTAGRIVRWKDRNGMWYRYEFDAEGRCVQAEGAGGYLNVSLAYDQENLVTSVTNSLGHTTRYQLNAQLQVIGETDPLGNITNFQWDPYDRLLARTDPLGRVTRYEYNAAGDVIAVTQPDGSRALAEYNAQRRPVTMIGPDGAVWRHEYDDRGKVVRTVDPVGAATSYGYDPAGNFAAITDALGNCVRIQANATGLPATVTNPLGATTRYDYDELGRLRAITDPLGGVTRLSWTVEGKLRERVEPDGAVWRWNHDGEGNATESIDAQGNATRTEFAHFDLPVAEIDPDGGRLAYAYDTELRLASVTNEQGMVWRYTYDAAGNLVSETDFNGRLVRYSYDAAGQLVRRDNGAGQRLTIERDALGRTVKRQAGDSVVVFGYDLAGRMLSARNADAEITLHYDALGRVLAESVNGRVVRSDYDVLGRRIRRRAPSGAESTWEYNDAGQPIALHAAGRTLRFDYDHAGREVLRHIGNTTTLRQTWDADHRLSSQTLLAETLGPQGVASTADRVLQRREYAYQRDGYLSAITDALSGPRRIEIGRSGRVEAVHGQGWLEHYAYDRAGKVVQAEWPAPPDAAAVGPRRYAGTLLLAAGNLHYRHDAEGRVVAKQRLGHAGQPETWQYRWNTEDRLVGVSTPDGQSWRYHYDALGRRVAKQRLTADGRTVEQFDFSWDGAELVEQVHGGVGLRPAATVWDWEPGGGQPVSQTERPLGPNNARDRVNERFYAIVTDLVGSPSELVDDAGNVAWHAHTTLWGSLLSRPGAAYTPLRFPGQYHDLETGLHYNFHRYYDPETGRYISHDPLGLDPAPDSLAYVVNPTGWIDPLGLAPCNNTQGKGNSNKVNPGRAQGGKTGEIKLGNYHGYDTYLESHQNKHQSTKIGELGTFASKSGTQFPANVGIPHHENYLGPTAASIGKQGPPESPALTNKHDAYLTADQHQYEKYQNWQDVQKSYNHDKGATAADVNNARQDYLDAKNATAARQDDYGQAHQKYNKDGYVDSQGNFTTNAQASRDGIRYQTTTDNTTNPPHVSYHAYPDKTAGGVDKWKQHDSKAK